MTTPHPFRFGVNCTTTSRAQLLEAARKAEVLGFSTFIAQDHFGNQMAPVPALAAVAAVTTTLRLATLVLDNDFRHPALLAKEAATLDVLSDGRLELGLGAGWLQSDYTRTGLPFDPPGQRLDRLRESIQICKLLLSSAAPVTYRGTHYQIENLEPLPRPVQRPRPPMMLGGRQRRMLALAAQEADIVGISLLGLGGPSFAEKVAWVREAAGPRFEDLELHVNASRVDVSASSAAAEVLGSPGALVGTVDQVVETLIARREAFGLSYYVIKADAMDAFAPVIARVP